MQYKFSVMDEKITVIQKLNPWQGRKLPAGMPRKHYTERVEQYIGNRLVKVFVGQRRAGKSYLLRQVMNALLDKGVAGHNIFYISKEYMEFDFLNDYKALESLYQTYRQEVAPTGKCYLFIDEIQNIDGWERFVNSHSQDFTDECELFISGSNSRMLSSELATLLSGRYVEFHVYPFRYAEYRQMKQKEASRDSYLEYLKQGGLPGLFELPTEEARRHYVASVKDTIMLRDIIQRKQDEKGAPAVRDAKLLDDLFVYVISNASNPISIQNILRYFKGRQRRVAYETVANYLRYIEETFLIHPVMQYQIKGKSVAESAYKYYANDLSFKNFLYPGVAYGWDYLLENAVCLELLCSGFLVYEGCIRDKEVDFVAVKGDRIIYIQCAYSIEDDETRRREYASLQAIGDNFEKWVVTLDDLPYPNQEGIRHLQAWRLEEFL